MGDLTKLLKKKKKKQMILSSFISLLYTQTREKTNNVVMCQYSLKIKY